MAKKKQKPCAKLTDKEEGAWNFAYEFYGEEAMEKGKDEDWVRKKAWKDLQLEFPRLRNYRDCQ